MSEKSTYAEVDQRVTKIYELLINSWNRHDILEYVRRNTDWDVERAQIDNYIALAKVIIKENAKQTQEEWLEDVKNKFSDLYKKAMSMKKISECRKIIETANKVLGYERVSINHKIDGVLKNYDVELTAEEKEEYEQKLKESMGIQPIDQLNKKDEK